MGTSVFWNALLTYKILAVSLGIAAIAMLIINESACATGLYDRSKPINLIWELPFEQWSETHLHASDQSPYLIIWAMSERGTFFTSGRDLLVWDPEEG